MSLGVTTRTHNSVQINLQVTDNPGTSVQPSWLAGDVKSSFSFLADQKSSMPDLAIRLQSNAGEHSGTRGTNAAAYLDCNLGCKQVWQPRSCAYWLQGSDDLEFL